MSERDVHVYTRGDGIVLRSFFPLDDVASIRVPTEPFAYLSPRMPGNAAPPVRETAGPQNRTWRAILADWLLRLAVWIDR